MDKRLRAWLVAPTLVLVGATAHAQWPGDRGWYGGIAAGQSSIDFGSLLPNAGATASAETRDDTDTAIKLFAGYRFNRHLAMEAGYTDFGDFSATRRITVPAPGSITSEIKSAGVHFDVLGIIPVGERFELYGRLGVIRTATTTDLSATGVAVISAPAHNKDYNVSPRIGVGAQWNASRALGIRVEFEKQDIDSQIFSESASIDVISAALVILF